MRIRYIYSVEYEVDAERVSEQVIGMTVMGRDSRDAKHLLGREIRPSRVVLVKTEVIKDHGHDEGLVMGMAAEGMESPERGREIR